MFAGYPVITTKNGLTKALHKYEESNPDPSIDTFFPKSFILSDDEPFRQEFRAVLAESVLKKAMLAEEITIQTLLAFNFTEKRL